MVLSCFTEFYNPQKGTRLSFLEAFLSTDSDHQTGSANRTKIGDLCYLRSSALHGTSPIFPNAYIAKVPVSLWGLGVEGAFARRCATVRNRPREGRMAMPLLSLQKRSLLEVSHVALLRFAWQALHFVTFRRVL